MLREHGADPMAHFLDQLKSLPKATIFRLSHEAIAVELPTEAEAFKVLENDGEATTLSGRVLQAFVKDRLATLSEHTVFDIAKAFICQDLAHAIGVVDDGPIRWQLYPDAFFEHEKATSTCLQWIRGLWLLDPRSASSPDNAKPAVYRNLDRTSIWAYWSRQFTNPFFIDVNKSGQRLGAGYIYDLRSMVDFAPPEGDLRPLIKDLLREADLLRVGSIPPRAFVEVNFPPFTMLVFEEINPAFVMVEALDANDRVLPIYLFPSSVQWAVPNTGCGPDGRIGSFDGVVNILVAMAAAAVRDFWVVEERDRVLGPPRIARVPNSKCAERRVIYLPRIRYTGGVNLVEKAERASNIAARAAHWRSEHYRKLVPGQKPSFRQIALAEAFNRTPPDGCTWVRGASVAGVKVEKIYRSRSISEVLFDVIPSKAQVLSGLSWFEFEQHCTRWLSSMGFDEVARASVDQGVDITALKGSGPLQKWVIQCKHWKKKIGPEIVRELEGARTLRRADRAMLIASSAFTAGAIETADQLGIELVDGGSLLQPQVDDG